MTLANLHKVLKDVPVYDLPLLLAESAEGVKTIGSGGVYLLDHPVAAFKFADNWYVAPKVDGNIPSDPAHWSLVTDGLDFHPNTRFYHEPNLKVEMHDTHLSTLQDISTGLSTKEQAGTLSKSNHLLAPGGSLSAGPRTLSPTQMATIVLSKEQEGAGFAPGKKEPLNQFITEHGTAPFQATHEEIMAASDAMRGVDLDARHARLTQERIALHGASGKAFMAKPKGGSLGKAFSDPRERIFFAPHRDDPGLMRRLKVGFQELLQPDGKRIFQPSLVETAVPVESVLEEIGSGAHIGHAPEGVDAFLQTGDHAGIARYAQTHIGGELAARQQMHDMATTAGADRFLTPTSYSMGEELAGKNLTTQAWHRVMRESDYVPQNDGHTTPGAGIQSAEYLAFNSKRADYFLIRRHPDYSEALKTGDLLYNGPRDQLLFYKGDPSGVRPHAVEMVDLRDGVSAETVIELRKRGIGADTKLLKIGEDEYAELWNQRKLGDHVNDPQLRRETAKETFQSKPLEHYKFGTDHPLKEPIRIDAGGKLVGDVGGLSHNGLYKLGNDHFVHIVPEIAIGRPAEKFNYKVYQASVGGNITQVESQLCAFDGEFEHRLAEMIKQKGALVQATEHEVLNVAQHLHQTAKMLGDDKGLLAAHDLSQLMHSEKPRLPDPIGTRLQQAAEGTLKSTYTELFAKQKSKPPVKDPIIPRDEPPRSRVRHDPLLERQPHVVPNENATAKTEGALARFMKNEKWMGMKGVVFAGGTLLIGAVIYSANKAAEKKQDGQTWVDRTSDSNTSQRSPGA